MEIKKSILALILLVINNSCFLKKDLMHRTEMEIRVDIIDPRIISFYFQIQPEYENLEGVHEVVKESMNVFSKSNLVEYIYDFQHTEYDVYGNKLEYPSCDFMVVFFETMKEDGHNLTLEYLKNIENDKFLQKTISVVHVISQ